MCCRCAVELGGELEEHAEPVLYAHRGGLWRAVARAQGALLRVEPGFAGLARLVDEVFEKRPVGTEGKGADGKADTPPA